MVLPELILNKRTSILVLIAFLTVFLSFFAFRIQLNQNPEELVFQNDPEYPLLKAFFSDFGYDQNLVAVYSADNVLDKEHLDRIRQITSALQDLEQVQKVLSLTNAEDVVAHNGTIEIRPLVRTLPDTVAEQEALRNRIEENPIYKDVMISQDATSALFDITLRPDLSSRDRDTTLKKVDTIFATHSMSNRYYLSGFPYAVTEFFRCIRRDFSTLLPLGMLLLVLSMYFIFRHYLCILLPLTAVSLGVVWSIGLMYLVGSELNFLSVLIPTILFIIGTSDCVHILSQYQDCRYICTGKQEAVETTLRLMFVPCLLTTFTTMVCLSSLQFSHVEAFRLFGVFTAAGVGFTFFLSITLLPIGLAMGDTKPLSIRKSRSEVFLGILDRVNRIDNVYKKPVLILSVLVLLLGAYGTTRLDVETDAIKVFGKNFKGVSDTIYISKELGGVIPLYVLIDSQQEDGVKDPALLRDIEALTEFLVLQEGVDKVVSASDLVKYMNYRFHESDPSFYRLPDERQEIAQLLLMASLSDDAGTLRRFFDALYQTTPIGIRYSHTDLTRIQGINNRIRDYLQHRFDAPPSVRAYTTGTAILWANTVFPIRAALQQSLVLASVFLFALMVFMFRSVMVGVISMVPNLVPIVMTLGMMGLLDIPLNLGTAPVAAIALGIAIDDTIHFLSRFRMELHKDHDYPGAIQRTIRSVGKPILITSLILTVGFFIFLLSNFQFTQNMGVLISFTVISAIFGDLILLPILLLIFEPIKG